MKNLANVFKLHPSEAHQRVESLTDREREIAELMAFGWCSDTIAERLGIAQPTLAVHRTNIKRKLQTTVAGIGRVWFLAQLAEGADIEKR